MKPLHTLKSSLLALSAGLCLQAVALAATADDVTATLQLARAAYQVDRQAFLTDRLGLTDAEGTAFWPLYRSYRADMEKLGDDILKLVLEYADAYPGVPEKRAAALLKQYTSLEQKLTRTRASYLKRAEKLIPPSKVLRWAQLENRLDLAWRAQLASVIPLVPATSGQP